MELLEVPLECLREPGNSDRIELDEEGIRELASSLQTEGLLHPLHVKHLADGIFEVVAGHRRLMAIRLLRWPKVPCFLVPPGLDPEFVKVHENLHRRNLSPYEEALAVGRMHSQMSMTYDQIAVASSRSVGWVVDRMKVLAFPEGLREMLRDGSVSLQVAKVLAKIDDPFTLSFYAENAAQNGVTERVARYWLMLYEQNGPIARVETEKGFEAVEPPPPVDPPVPCDLGGHQTLLSMTRIFRACGECAAAMERAKAGL